MTEKIYFAHHSQKYQFLSNFARSRFRLKGFSWMTVEHYFQAMKFEGTNEMHIRRVQGCRTASEARQLGRELSPLRSDWEDVKVDIMREAIRAKFAQNLMMAKHLENTGDAELIEDLPDEFWGRGRHGEGQNWTGRILMEIREERREEGLV
jgi:ribA/ribD-fused uncharacterized protein